MSEMVAAHKCAIISRRVCNEVHATPLRFAFADIIATEKLLKNDAHYDIKSGKLNKVSNGNLGTWLQPVVQCIIELKMTLNSCAEPAASMSVAIQFHHFSAFHIHISMPTVHVDRIRGIIASDGVSSILN